MIICCYRNIGDCLLKITNNLFVMLPGKKLNAKMCIEILYCSNENILKKKQKCKINNGYGLL
jgi:hypothetical protein